MPELIASIFPHAVAVALSPMPIAALILLLLSGRPKANSIAFLAGWILAIFGNVFVFMTIVSAEPTGSRSTVGDITNGILGVLLLFLAFKEWNMRPNPGKKPKTPKWMATIDSFTPIKSFLIAVALVTINAKNTVIDIATGALIAEKSANLAQGLTAVTVFAAISSLTIAIPVVAFLLYGKRLKGSLAKLKTWFIYHSALILSILFFFLGLELLYKAFYG